MTPARNEVMSEPRTFAPFEVVHAAQREACDAVWAHDPRAACVIGAARYYNRFRLNASLLIRGGGPVLYAANFFEPKVRPIPTALLVGWRFAYTGLHTVHVCIPWAHTLAQPLRTCPRAEGVALEQ